MNKIHLFCLYIGMCALSACQENPIPLSCDGMDNYCKDGYVYECANNETDPTKIWRVRISCNYNGCNEDNKTCRQNPDCKSGWKDDGSCITSRDCKYGIEEKDGSCLKALNCYIPNEWEDDGSCRKVPDCKLGNEEDGSCIKMSGCANGNADDGSCIQTSGCVNGNSENGTCIQSSGCAIGNADDGSCIKSENCFLGNAADGSCITAPNCINGYGLNGSCYCSDDCVNGCDETGACLCPNDSSEKSCEICDSTGAVCCPGNCVKGCNSDGSCLCEDNCSNGCNVDGTCCSNACVNGCGADTQCICPDHCTYQDEKTHSKCDETGVCLPDPTCRNGNKLDGSCLCPSSCEKGCLPNGACYYPESCSEENSCDKYSSCFDITSQGELRSICYCSNGKCDRIDANQNHMHDQYETAPRQGESCRMDSDCGTDGFCDSLIGYRCSTRCASDDQCVEDNTYHYICRDDGRCAPEFFVTVWNITQNGTTITIPIRKLNDDGVIENYDYKKGHDSCNLTVKLNDPNSDGTGFSCDSNIIEINNVNKGTNTVYITGNFGPFGFSMCPELSESDGKCGSSDANNASLIGIDAFGPVRLARGAFAKCTNLVSMSAVDIPNSRYLTLMDGMFFYAKSFNYGIENWDVSNVKSLYGTFWRAYLFDQPLERWNVSNVTNMESTFRAAHAFDQPLEKWDVSSVTSMKEMFFASAKFNQPLNGWGNKLLHVEDMSSMFGSDDKTDVVFDHPLDAWNVSNVNNMYGMFAYNKKFNQPLSSWDVSNVKDMSRMFLYATSFNQSLNEWNLSNVTTTSKMFYGASSFNGDITKWDVSNVTSMNQMFTLASVFNQPIANWERSDSGTSTLNNVTNMKQMFYKATAFNQDLSQWKVEITKAEKVQEMFEDAGISKTNLCKIMLSDTWKAKPISKLYVSVCQECLPTNTCDDL